MLHLNLFREEVAVFKVH